MASTLKNQNELTIYRYAVAEKATGEVLAIIEARDALEATERHARIRSLQPKITSGILSIRETDETAPFSVPFYPDGIFGLMSELDLSVSAQKTH